jgi:hypothetical protein
MSILQRTSITVLAVLALGAPGASAGQQPPQYEVTGFPITPLQMSVVRPGIIQEEPQAPALAPCSRPRIVRTLVDPQPTARLGPFLWSYPSHSQESRLHTFFRLRTEGNSQCLPSCVLKKRGLNGLGQQKPTSTRI